MDYIGLLLLSAMTQAKDQLRGVVEMDGITTVYVSEACLATSKETLNANR